MSERMVERVVDPVHAAKLGAMSMILMGIPQSEQRVDAVAVFPGLGETWRVEQAVRSWEDKAPNARHLLVAGTNPGERTYRRLDVPGLQLPPFNLRRTEGVLTQVEADNTPHQAEWLADQVEEGDIASFSLHVSPYHMLRAYCTTLKTFEKRGLDRVAIIPRPVNVAPGTVIPETGEDAVSMYNGEARRIELYQAKGDVATLDELQAHVDWMWQQPVLADA
ncbi:MAG TPA: hypothetical protein VFT16_02080 [Candidatus Saccharimonadales bacterium]|nr:hypothetical protein [Candidatus Saccharimonadales bacterium]